MTICLSHSDGNFTIERGLCDIDAVGNGIGMVAALKFGDDCAVAVLVAVPIETDLLSTVIYCVVIGVHTDIVGAQRVAEIAPI